MNVRSGLAIVASSLALLVPGLADAQVIGTFRWQQLPYCNVVTLTVVQNGANYLLDGFDDQCGATRLASASGVAFPNPDGTIGMGISIVTSGVSSGGSPLHLDVAISLATISGTWRANTGQSGTWSFLAGPPAAGAPRPSVIPTFPAGLGAGGAPITGVGTPVAGTDAANKTYVDATAATVKSQLFPLIVLGGYVNLDGTKDGSGPYTSARSGTGNYSIAYNLTGLNVPGALMPLVITATPSYQCGAGTTARADWSSYTVSNPATNISLAVQLVNSAAAPVDCPFSFIATFDPQSPLTSAADTSGDGDGTVTCFNTPTGVVCR
jgi:hypothetical protein